MPSINRDHPLADLIGRKIKDITLREIDVLGDGGNVRQFYKITCADGDVLILACDGGSDDSQYATAMLIEESEFAEFMEETEAMDVKESEELELDSEVESEDADSEDEEIEEDDARERDLNFDSEID